MIRVNLNIFSIPLCLSIPSGNKTGSLTSAATDQTLQIIWKALSTQKYPTRGSHVFKPQVTCPTDKVKPHENHM